MNISKYKIAFIFVVIIILGLVTFLFINSSNKPEGTTEDKGIIGNLLETKPTFKSELEKNEIVNVLLVGKDIGRERRSKGQTGYNTDTIILLSINPKEKRAILTSFPRDIWQNGAKINAILVTQGMDSLLKAMSDISGQKIEKYITIDFDGMRWLVDAFGGVPVEVQTSFTDTGFPNNADTAVMSVSFQKGTEIMTGERALTFARSRKGNNGEGSDLMRAKRQHLILKGMVSAVENKNSQFFPFDIQEFYEEVVKNTQTNVSLDDAYYMFSFYSNIKEYNIKSLVLDDRYIYHPTDASPYGGAWVFVSKDPGYRNLHKDVREFLINGRDFDIKETQSKSSNP